MRVTLKEAKNVGDKLGVNFNVLDVHTLRDGMKVELEHGLIDKRTNVTNDDLIQTAKIALAHIAEYPDYYDRLEKLEKQAEKKWKNKKKPNIFL